MTTIDIDETTRKHAAMCSGPHGTADPLRRIIEDRVEELLRFRHWYRVHRAINLDTIEAMHTTELRALVRLLRAARLQEKADTVWHAPAANGTPPQLPLEQLDPVTLAKGFHDWQAGA